MPLGREQVLQAIVIHVNCFSSLMSFNTFSNFLTRMCVHTRCSLSMCVHAGCSLSVQSALSPGRLSQSLECVCTHRVREHRVCTHSVLSVCPQCSFTWQAESKKVMCPLAFMAAEISFHCSIEGSTPVCELCELCELCMGLGIRVQGLGITLRLCVCLVCVGLGIRAQVLAYASSFFFLPVGLCAQAWNMKIEPSGACRNSQRVSAQYIQLCVTVVCDCVTTSILQRTHSVTTSVPQYIHQVMIHIHKYMYTYIYTHMHVYIHTYAYVIYIYMHI